MLLSNRITSYGLFFLINLTIAKTDTTEHHVVVGPIIFS